MKTIFKLISPGWLTQPGATAGPPLDAAVD